MNASLVVLHRALEAMGLGHLLPAEGDTDEQRLDKERQVQFAGYLMQELAGVDLGYHFRWQPRLTSDALHRRMNESLCKDLKHAHEDITGVVERLKMREKAGIFGKKEIHAETIRNLEESLWRIKGSIDRLVE